MARNGMLLPILFGVVGTAILIGLGVWQMQRLEWKEGLIDRIEARMAQAPVAVPDNPAKADHHLLRVAVSGRTGPDEIHVITSIKRLGPGFRVIMPVDMDGRRVMVDLGFVPEAEKDTDRGAPRDLAVTGFVYWPEEVDSFTPEPDQGRGIWFARDVARMADHLSAEAVLIVAQTHDLGDWPRPRPPGVDAPNRHLEYALTWFGLAFVWASMTLVWIRSNRREAG